jgi:D-serine deaminase-like pyridoxal phosphate-dependent protein
MTYSTEEALWLRSLGFENLLVGYPKWDTNSLGELSKNSKHIILMVDSVEQLEILAKYATSENPFKLCLDVDLSLDLPLLRFGVFRSPIQKIEDLEKIIIFLKNSPHLVLMSIMGYEAQIAGVGDKNQWLIQLLKKISIPKLRARRLAVLNYLKQK